MPANILTTPQRDSYSTNPTILFTSISSREITLEVLEDGTLSFQGSAGELFSINDSLTGTLMAITNQSGLPIFEVDSNNSIVMGTYGTDALVVSGNKVGVRLSYPNKELTVSGEISATSNIYANNIYVEGTIDGRDIALDGYRLNTIVSYSTSTSAGYAATKTVVNSNSAGWTTAKSTFNTNSASYAAVRSTTTSNSARWMSSWTTLTSNSATFINSTSTDQEKAGKLTIHNTLCADSIIARNQVSIGSSSVDGYALVTGTGGILSQSIASSNSFVIGSGTNNCLFYVYDNAFGTFFLVDPSSGQVTTTGDIETTANQRVSGDLTVAGTLWTTSNTLGLGNDYNVITLGDSTSKTLSSFGNNFWTSKDALEFRGDGSSTGIVLSTGYINVIRNAFVDVDLGVGGNVYTKSIELSSNGSNGAIHFTGSEQLSTKAIRLEVLPEGDIAFTGNAGTLFGIDDTLDGTLLSINNAAGMPVLQVDSDNTVTAGTYGKNALVVAGSATYVGKTSSTNDDIFEVQGDIYSSGLITATSLNTTGNNTVSGSIVANSLLVSDLDVSTNIDSANINLTNNATISGRIALDGRLDFGPRAADDILIQATSDGNDLSIFNVSSNAGVVGYNLAYIGSGSGNSNYLQLSSSSNTNIVRWDQGGNSRFDDSTLSIIASTNRVGINVGDPGATLTVNGILSTNDYYYGKGATYSAGLAVDNPAGFTFAYFGGNGTVQYGGSDAGVDFTIQNATEEIVFSVDTSISDIVYFGDNLNLTNNGRFIVLQGGNHFVDANASTSIFSVTGDIYSTNVYADNLARSLPLMVADESALFATTVSQLNHSHIARITTGSVYTYDNDVLLAVDTDKLSSTDGWVRLTPLGTEQISIRSGTRAELDTASPALLSTEPALESDTGTLRLGNRKYTQTNTFVNNTLYKVLATPTDFMVDLPGSGWWRVEATMYGTLDYTSSNGISLSTIYGSVSATGAIEVRYQSANETVGGVFYDSINNLKGDIGSYEYNTINVIYVYYVPLSATIGVVETGSYTNAMQLARGSHIIATRLSFE